MNKSIKTLQRVAIVSVILLVAAFFSDFTSRANEAIEYEPEQYEIDYRTIEDPQGKNYKSEIGIVKADGSEDAALIAQQTAHNLINTYADPQYHSFVNGGDNYRTTPEQEAELKALAQSLIADCTSDYDIIWTITEYVADTIYYDNEYYYGYTDTTALEPYDVYTDKKTVCFGYAKLVQTLLNYVDIPCMGINGDNHVYNAAYDSDNDRWIFLDATWCSLNVYTSDQEWVYNGVDDWCFDMSPEQMADMPNHEVYGIPGLASNESEDFYYNVIIDYTDWTDITKWSVYIMEPRKSGNLKAVSNIGGVWVKNIIGTGDWSEVTAVDLSQTKISTIAGAFRDCTNLTTVSFPDTLTQIGGYTFYNCTNLTTVNFPDALTQIVMYAFYNCQSITELDLSQTKVSSVGLRSFYNCTNLTTVSFPESLTEIEDAAFSGCKSINEINLGETRVSTIGSAAFSGNSASIISLPPTLTSIGASAFSYYIADGGAAKETLVVTELTAQQIGYEGPDKVNSPWGGRVVTISRVNPKVQLRAFVERMYTVALGREGEQSGIEYWVEKLLSGENNGAGIAQGFLLSPEFVNKNHTDSDYVKILYTTFFERVPVDNEANYWIGKLADGNRREAVLAGFVNSDEFDGLCSGYGISRGFMREDGTVINPGIIRFTERLYTKALERTGEKEGIEYWAIGIADGVLTPEEAAKSFFLSPEYVNKNTTDEQYIKALYRTFMDREAEADGLSFWKNHLNNGVTRETVLTGFARSTEFREIMAQYGL